MNRILQEQDRILSLADTIPLTQWNKCNGHPLMEMYKAHTDGKTIFISVDNSGKKRVRVNDRNVHIRGNDHEKYFKLIFSAAKFYHEYHQ